MMMRKSKSEFLRYFGLRTRSKKPESHFTYITCPGIRLELDTAHLRETIFELLLLSIRNSYCATDVTDLIERSGMPTSSLSAPPATPSDNQMMKRRVESSETIKLILRCTCMKPKNMKEGK